MTYIMIAGWVASAKTERLFILLDSRVAGLGCHTTPTLARGNTIRIRLKNVRIGLAIR